MNPAFNGFGRTYRWTIRFGIAAVALYGVYRLWVSHYAADEHQPFIFMLDALCSLPFTATVALIFGTAATELLGITVYVGAGISWAIMGGLVGFQIDYFQRQRKQRV